MSLESIEEYSQEFYLQHRRRILSIILLGSMSRVERKDQPKPADADIMIVTKSFLDFTIAKKFLKGLSRRIDSIPIETGILPLGRIINEKSLLTYDIKYSGRILAGKDVKQEMPEIDVKELSPFEPFRLMLNRGISLVESVIAISSDIIELDETKFRLVSARILRAYVDFHLLLNGTYFFEDSKKKEAFNRLITKEIPSGIRNFDQARLLILDALSYGFRQVGCNCFGELIRAFRGDFKYLSSYRLATFWKTRRFDALVTNPIFEAYTLVYDFLLSKNAPGGAQHAGDWEHFRRYVVDLWKNSPQPIVNL